VIATALLADRAQPVLERLADEGLVEAALYQGSYTNLVYRPALTIPLPGRSATEATIPTGPIDVALLRRQRDWTLTLAECDEREGLTHLLDHLLDRAEGCDTETCEPGLVVDASSIEAGSNAAQRRELRAIRPT